MKIGMIFPGQGSQFMGMCKEFYDEERLVQEYFEEASNCLNQNFVRLCFASSDKELLDPINTQTSIFLVSASIFQILKEEFGIIPDVVAGHSLGEYSAIFAAGGINFPDALYLLKKRAMFMQEATKDFPNQGMFAVIGVPYQQLQEIVKKYNNDEAVVEIVNYNSPTQFVISGTLQDLELASVEIKLLRGKVIPLNVSGAFHSRLMHSAQKNFSAYMQKVNLFDLDIPLINNVDAAQILSASEVKDSLVRQISAPVLWWKIIEQLKDCDLIIEVGPSNKLSKIISREWPEKKVIAINENKDLEALNKLLEEIS